MKTVCSLRCDSSISIRRVSSGLSPSTCNSRLVFNSLDQPSDSSQECDIFTAEPQRRVTKLKSDFKNVCCRVTLGFVWKTEE